MNAASAPASASTTTTATGILHLRGEHTDQRRVQWTESTIDNENAGRKSSKICCIYHKPKEYDESSSSSDDSDSGDEHDKALKEKMRRLQEVKEAKLKEHHPDCSCDNEKNAYEKK